MIHLFSGLKAWYYQRISALFLLFALPYLVWQIFSHDWNYTLWNQWVHHSLHSVILLLTTWALLLHAWVGLRDIIIDYLSNAWLKLTALTISATVLFTLGVWVTILLFNN